MVLQPAEPRGTHEILGITREVMYLRNALQQVD